MQSGITLGLVTKNRPEYLQRLLSMVMREESQHLKEVIVYDNGDDYETEEIVKEFSLATYLRGKKMQPGGRNEILKRTKTKIICFWDDDCLPFHKGYFEFLWEDYSRNSGKKIGCIGGPVILVHPDGTPSVKVHGGRGYNRILGNGKTILEQDHSSCWVPDEICEVDFLPGGNMSFKTFTLISIGGFDETYGRGTAFEEETDPQLTLRRHGFINLYDPRLRINHYRASTGGVRTYTSSLKSFKDRYYNARNHVYFMRKHNLLSFDYFVEWWRWLILLYGRGDAVRHFQATNTLANGSVNKTNGSQPNQCTSILRNLINLIPLLAGHLAEIVQPSNRRC